MSKLGGEKSGPTGASPSTVTWRNEPGLVCDYTNTCTSFLWRGWDLRYLVRPSSVISVAQRPYVSQRNLRVGKTTCGKERRANTTKSWAVSCLLCKLYFITWCTSEVLWSFLWIHNRCWIPWTRALFLSHLLSFSHRKPSWVETKKKYVWSKNFDE